jgi:hypothetical protein
MGGDKTLREALRSTHIINRERQRIRDHYDMFCTFGG